MCFLNTIFIIDNFFLVSVLYIVLESVFFWIYNKHNIIFPSIYLLFIVNYMRNPNFKKILYFRYVFYLNLMAAVNAAGTFEMFMAKLQ